MTDSTNIQGEPSAPAPTPDGPVAPVEPMESAPPAPPVESPPESLEPGSPAARDFLWQGKLTPAYWTIASIISLAINIILFVVLIILGTQLFNVKKIVEEQVIGGLYDAFVQMDEANIVTTIVVSDTIHVNDSLPVVFTLPLKQETEVVLTRDAPIKKATVFLNGVGVPTDIILKKGTRLNVYLEMAVAVDQVVPVELEVPVSLTVPVDIPLDQTELHQPFVGLQEVVLPYKELLERLPDSWGELVCSSFPDTWCE